jgi:hypothetical protein
MEGSIFDDTVSAAVDVVTTLGILTVAAPGSSGDILLKACLWNLVLLTNLCSRYSIGMPDDCTVIVGHVVGRAAGDLMDKDNL